jgi:hypothetical protein
MCDLPVAKAGLGVLWAARGVAEAVLHGGAHRRAAFWPRDWLRSTTSNAKRIRGMCCSLRARFVLNGRARVTTARSERRRRPALMEKFDAGLLRASDHHGSARGAPAEMLRGLRRAGNHRRRGIEGEE